jgi:hypothetical protein
VVGKDEEELDRITGLTGDLDGVDRIVNIK